MKTAAPFLAILVFAMNTSAQDVFQIDSPSGAPLMAINNVGDLIVVSGTIYENATTSLTPQSNVPEFTIEDDNGILLRLDSSTGHLHLKGEVMNTSAISASGGAAEFTVEASPGNELALLDGNSDMHIVGIQGLGMKRTLSASTYTTGGSLDITITLSYGDPADIMALGVVEQLPANWTFNSFISGCEPDQYPAEEATNELGFIWLDEPTFPCVFTYRVNVPEEACGIEVITGQAYFRTAGPQHTSNESLSRIEPSSEGECEGEGESILNGLGLDISCYHSTDTNEDHRINVNELLRVIQFYNIGSFHCDATNIEDGYAPGAGDEDCPFYSSDYDQADFTINLNELLRTIQFYNSARYYVDGTTEDGFSTDIQDDLDPMATYDTLDSDSAVVNASAALNVSYLLSPGSKPSLECFVKQTLPTEDCKAYIIERYPFAPSAHHPTDIYQILVGENYTRTLHPREGHQAAGTAYHFCGSTTSFFDTVNWNVVNVEEEADDILSVQFACTGASQEVVSWSIDEWK